MNSMMNAVAGRSVPSVEPSAVSSSVPFVSPHQWEQWLNAMPLRAWLRSRPADCVAAQCVDAVLEAALGPLRVVVCTESASVPLLSIKDTSSGFSRGIHIVDVAWPVTQGGVDLAVLVHSNEVGTRAKARMAAGPMLFTHCESAAEVPLLVADLLRSCPDGDLVGARQRVLHGEVRAIAYRFPEVADALEKALAACGPPPLVTAPYEQEPVLAVIGPDSTTTTTVALQLRQRWQVADKPHAGVDVVIAAAPPQGWGPHDTPTLADAMAKVGRVVSTAALPPEAVPGWRRNWRMWWLARQWGSCPCRRPHDGCMPQSVRISGRRSGCALSCPVSRGWRDVDTRRRGTALSTCVSNVTSRCHPRCGWGGARLSTPRWSLL